MKNFSLLVLLFIFSACGTNTSEESKQWESHDTDDFQAFYPSNWELDISGNAGTTFYISSPSDSFGDPFRENVNLLIQDLEDSELNSLDSFIEFSKVQVKQMSPDSEFFISKNVESNGRTHHEISYTFAYQATPLKCKQFIWVENDHAYILTFTALEETFNEYEEIGTEILSRFELKG